MKWHTLYKDAVRLPPRDGICNCTRPIRDRMYLAQWMCRICGDFIGPRWDDALPTREVDRDGR